MPRRREQSDPSLEKGGGATKLIHMPPQRLEKIAGAIVELKLHAYPPEPMTAGYITLCGMPAEPVRIQPTIGQRGYITLGSMPLGRVPIQSTAAQTGDLTVGGVSVEPGGIPQLGGTLYSGSPLSDLEERQESSRAADTLSAAFSRFAEPAVQADEALAHADETEVAEVARVLSSLAPVVLRLLRERRAEIREELLRQFVGAGVSPNPLDIEEARQRAHIIRGVFAGADWAPAADLAKITNVSVAAVLDWRNKGKIFCVSFEGKDWYPLYAINDRNRPIPQLAKVIAILGEYSDLAKAAWFDSPSSFLDAARPREVLASDPQRVVDAAEDAIASEHVA